MRVCTLCQVLEDAFRIIFFAYLKPAMKSLACALLHFFIVLLLYNVSSLYLQGIQGDSGEEGNILKDGSIGYI